MLIKIFLVYIGNEFSFFILQKNSNYQNMLLKKNKITSVFGFILIQSYTKIFKNFNVFIFSRSSRCLLIFNKAKFNSLNFIYFV